jgi:hypothetical protein
MTSYADQPYKLKVPNESNAMRMVLGTMLHPVPSSSRVRNRLEEYTAASEENILGFRRWTEEDLEIFAEEDELDAERAQRLEAFLRAE